MTLAKKGKPRAATTPRRPFSPPEIMWQVMLVLEFLSGPRFSTQAIFGPRWPLVPRTLHPVDAIAVMNNNQYSYDEHRRSAAATRNSRYARAAPFGRAAHSAAASASDTSKASRYASTSFTSRSDASTLET